MYVLKLNDFYVRDYELNKYVGLGIYEVGDVKLTRDFNKAKSFKGLEDAKASFFKEYGFKIYKITETEVTDEI